MATRYEWGLVVARDADDMDSGNGDFDGMDGCGLRHLREALKEQQVSEAGGMLAEVRLVRYQFDGYENHYDDATFTVGASAPLCLLDSHDDIPKRFLAQWAKVGGAA